MIVIPASLRSDFIHMAGMTIHIALESTIHIAGIRTQRQFYRRGDARRWCDTIRGTGRVRLCSTVHITVSPVASLVIQAWPVTVSHERFTWFFPIGKEPPPPPKKQEKRGFADDEHDQ